MPFNLLPEDTAAVPSSWFDAQHNPNYKNAVHKACHEEEILALRSFSNREMSVDEAAYAITQPISTTPIQDTGGYSDDCIALCHLWRLITKALIEWPSTCTPDVIALVSAITKIKDPIHRGEFLNDDDDDLCPWAKLPYLYMVWRETFWMTPGQIMRRATDATAMRQAHEIYVKQQDVASRLVAARIWEEKRAFQYLVRTLERIPTAADECIATGDADAEGQLKLTMQIPAASKWIQHNGERLYRDFTEQRDWSKKDFPSMALQFDQPVERWMFWQKRLLEIAKDDGLDESTKQVAQDTADRMQIISAA